MKLLVRNLSRHTTETELRSLFETLGKVQSCSLVLDKQTGVSKGFAFIEMPSPGHAKAAVKTLNGKDIGGNIIRVKKAAPKNSAVTPSQPADTSAKPTEPKIDETSADSTIADEPAAKNVLQSDETISDNSVNDASKVDKAINQNIWSK